MQTNPYPIVAVAIESESSNPFADIEQNQPNTCGCDKRTSSTGACICTDCKCHLTPFRIEDARLVHFCSLNSALSDGVLNDKRCKKMQTHDIVIPIPSPRIQCFGYGIIVSTVTIIAVYMLLQPTNKI